MKYSISNLLLITISLGLMGSSCLKEDIHIDLSSNPWKVVKIKEDGKLSYTDTDSTYILRFSNDTEYHLNLDVNVCFGFYEIPDQGKIEIQTMACTEVCCDTAFAEELAFLLPGMTEYYSRSGELYLEGEGKIVLQPH
ncbi:MAG: META domain-containing protein [Bacteroidota bacterium]|nr:META domain-containing protein [Bacteroidota bacterium]